MSLVLDFMSLVSFKSMHRAIRQFLHPAEGVLARFFSSEWSLAQFRLPEDVRSLAAFRSRGLSGQCRSVCNRQVLQAKISPKIRGNVSLSQEVVNIMRPDFYSLAGRFVSAEGYFESASTIRKPL